MRRCALRRSPRSRLVASRAVVRSRLGACSHEAGRGFLRRQAAGGRWQRVGGSENAFLVWSGDDQFDQKAAEAVLSNVFACN